MFWRLLSIFIIKPFITVPSTIPNFNLPHLHAGVLWNTLTMVEFSAGSRPLWMLGAIKVEQLTTVGAFFIGLKIPFHQDQTQRKRQITALSPSFSVPIRKPWWWWLLAVLLSKILAFWTYTNLQTKPAQRSPPVDYQASNWPTTEQMRGAQS